MLSLLATLTNDQADEVARAAEDGLIGQLHPLANDQFVFDSLVEALVQLQGSASRRLRSEAEQLLSLHARVEKGDPEVMGRPRQRSAGETAGPDEAGGACRPCPLATLGSR